jgi:HAE1 family hydrophobic/amphiphilic exporter-1
MNVEEAIRHGARQRLRPILMTALATVFALTPMAMGLTGGGGFISQPLAVVVIGGLVSSTALTLVLVPVLYRLVEGRREKKALRRQLHERPEFGPASDVDAEFRDWTTGEVPRVSGRRAAPGAPE